MMTREQYITSKTYNPLEVVYHYYLNHPSRNHKELGVNELFIFLQTRGYNLQQITQVVLDEYDRKYELIVLLDKRGNFIKYL
jgi:hypothetical protein